jgi:hypothetical protein
MGGVLDHHALACSSGEQKALAEVRAALACIDKAEEIRKRYREQRGTLEAAAVDILSLRNAAVLPSAWELLRGQVAKLTPAARAALRKQLEACDDDGALYIRLSAPLSGDEP